MIPIARGRCRRSSWPQSGRERRIAEHGYSTETGIAIRAPARTAFQAQHAFRLARDAGEGCLGPRPVIQIVVRLGAVAVAMRVSVDTTAGSLCHRMAMVTLPGSAGSGDPPSGARLTWHGRVLPAEATLAEATDGPGGCGALWAALTGGGCGASRALTRRHSADHDIQGDTRALHPPFTPLPHNEVHSSKLHYHVQRARTHTPTPTPTPTHPPSTFALPDPPIHPHPSHNARHIIHAVSRTRARALSNIHAHKKYPPQQ